MRSSPSRLSVIINVICVAYIVCDISGECYNCNEICYTDFGCKKFHI